jgi:hypothetical protein
MIRGEREQYLRGTELMTRDFMFVNLLCVSARKPENKWDRINLHQFSGENNVNLQSYH